MIDSLPPLIDFHFRPKKSQTCIGLIDDVHKSLVADDGSLCYGYKLEDGGLGSLNIPATGNVATRARLVTDMCGFAHKIRPRFSHHDEIVSLQQSYGDPRIPFVTTTEVFSHTHLQWDNFAFADVSGLRCDVIRWTLRAADTFGHAPSRVELLLTGAKEGMPPVLETAGTTRYWTREGLNLDGITHYAELKSGEQREGAFFVLLAGELPAERATLAFADQAAKLMTDYWLRAALFKYRFEIPEPQIMGMLQACARNILQAREIKDGLPEFQVGPTIYRGLWVIDGHFMLDAAQIMGLRDDAAAGLEALLRRQRPDGSFELLQDHLKETGIALATIVRQCELTQDDARIRSYWPRMLAALTHIKRLHAAARTLGPEYPAWELFPPAFIDGGLSGPYPEYSTPMWMLIGLKFAARVGGRLGLPEAKDFADLYLEINSAMRHLMQRDRRREGGIPFIPISMQASNYNRPQSATWVLAHAIWPGELFQADESVVTDFLTLLDSVDDAQGIPQDTGWIHDQAVWAYSSMFYAQVWLYAGRPDKAVDYLYAFANHAAPSRVWREEQSLESTRSAEYCGDMPHNWGAVEFIRLVRSLVVFECEQSLHFLRGVPASWLPTAGRDLCLQNTPTAFGDVSIRLRYVIEKQFKLILDLNAEYLPSTLILYWPGSVIAANGTVSSLRKDQWRLQLENGKIELALDLALAQTPDARA